MLRAVWFKIKSKYLSTVIVAKSADLLQRQQPKTAKRQNTHLSDYTPISSHHLVFLSLDFLHFPFMNTMSRSITECVEGIKPPNKVKGMTELDRSAFDCTVNILCICVPVEKLGVVAKSIKKYQLRMMKVKSVVELEKSDPKFKTHRLILLDPKEVQLFTSIADTVKQLEHEHEITEADFKHYDLKLSYNNWTFQEILRAVIPEDNEGVSGYSEVGHIAHFNLRSEVLPYKNLLGEVLIDKQPNIKTVVNKLNSIDNTYRNFQLELLAGEEKYMTKTKENGCTFELDFSKVYWNSRLATEHERIVKQISSGDIVFDVFAGIGPFAVPAAKKNATVYANDLNPSSYESLQKNTKLNKLKDNIKCFNLDGREFIQNVVKDELLPIYKKCVKVSTMDNSAKIHIVMNLPALAVTFLDAFKSLLPFNTYIPDNWMLPKVYCYCFTNFDEAATKWEGDVNKEVQHRVMGVVGPLEEGDISVRFVRNVAPNKDMMCVTFMLTRQILCGPEQAQEQESETGEPPQKCMKLDG